MWSIIFMLLGILYVFMLVSIILFENNSKKIIFWSLIVSFSSIVGYLIYFLFFCDKGNVKKYLHVKEKEDLIYKTLVGFSLDGVKPECELINFGKNVYKVNHYKNSKIEILKSSEEFNNQLITDIEQSKKFINIDTSYFLNSMNADNIVASLIEKKSLGIDVKVIYFKKKHKDNIYIKQLITNGVRCCKFKKFARKNKYYKNNKNIISIDGSVCYIYSTIHHKTNKINVEYLDLFYRLQGDIIKSVDLEEHLDVTFATQKFYNLKNYELNNITNDSEVQYIASSINNSLLDLILKALIEAKESIYIHLDKFIPNESILEAIKLAVKSNIRVKLMISNVNGSYGYYTSRSYVKELARNGVCCYFYDGHINSNYIIIDDEICMFGSFSLVNQSLLNDLQDVLIVQDKNISKEFIGLFDNSVNNSYKLCNPKRVLFREMFFRKFM